MDLLKIMGFVYLKIFIFEISFKINLFLMIVTKLLL